MRTLNQMTSGDDLLSFRICALNDFPFFMSRVLGLEVAPFHKAIADTFISESRQIRVVMARGHGKSFLCSAYITWCLWREENFHILYVSDTTEQAKKTVMRVQDFISENELLREMVPEDREFVWNKTECKTRSGNYFYIRPFSDSARGAHVDLLIADDILRNQDLALEQAEELFWSVFSPMVQTRKGKVFVVGTPLAAEDLLAKISEKPNWTCLTYPAVMIDDNGNWLEPLWPNRFTIEELHDIETNMGHLAFTREYLVNPIGSGASLFPEDMIRSQIVDTLINTPKPNCYYYLGVDVALSGSKTADFSVFTVLEKDQDEIHRVVRIERYKGWSVNKQLERIRELNRTFAFRKILIEDRGLSKGMVMDARVDLELKSVVDGFVTSHTNKEALISHLQAGFQSKTLFIPNNPILLKELGAFVVKSKRDGSVTYEALSGHDDCLMSLGFAYEAATNKPIGAASFALI